MEPEDQIVQDVIQPAGEESLVESVEEIEAVESDTTEETTAEEPAAAPPEKKKSGVQERFDEITRDKYEAMRERDYWREQVERLKKPEPAPEPVVLKTAAPHQDEFETYEQYDEALFDWRFQQRVAKEQSEVKRQDQQRLEQDRADKARTWAEEGSEKYPDFAGVALKEPRDGGPLVTPYMAEAIRDSEIGHDVAYYLGQNVKEAARISKLSPVAQLREIGRLEFKVQAPKQRETTRAPAPTAPVGGKESPSAKLEDMDYATYKAYRERQIVGGK